MWKVNRRSVMKRPASVHILIAVVVILDLYAMYLVNVEWLLRVSGLDRELYRKALATLAADRRQQLLEFWSGCCSLARSRAWHMCRTPLRFRHMCRLAGWANLVPEK
jgi:hypothetical protein